VQRQLQLIVLGHIWALAPLAGAWFLVPGWRGENPPPATPALAILTLAAGAYLAVRTALTLTSRGGSLAVFWPYVDALLITGALLAIRNPRDAMSILYFIPIASGVALLSVPHLVGLTAVMIAGYAVVIVTTGTPWAVDMLFRIIVIALIASLYGRVIRLVTAYAREVERAEYQAALAREMHDGIQHLLVTLSARLELATRLLAEAPSRAATIVAAERDTARRASDELRYLVRRGRTQDAAGVAGTLRAQLAATADRWPFTLSVDLPPALPYVPPATELAVLRVIQESMTNAAKHARAAMVEVRLLDSEGALTCTIRDDGVGFDPAAAGERGLAGLRERVRSLGGSLTVSTAAGTGTTVTAVFPLPRRERWHQSAS
jgi:signal transduction histidine kinase